MKKSIRFSTWLNQLSVLSNILLGVVLLPFIHNYYGINGLNNYLLFFAYKSVIDLFTSSLGGAFIRAMFDSGIKYTFFLSRLSFGLYSALIIISCLIWNFVSIGKGVNIYFVLFIILSLMQQPYLQRINASGYQYIGAISRIIYNLLLLGLITFLMYFDINDFEYVYLSIFISGSVAFLYIIFLNLKISHIEKIKWAQGETFKASKFFMSSFKGYSLFALFLGLTFQVEVIFLEKYVEGIVFAAVIISWKVPNIIVQFIWRFSEVSALEVKRKKVNNELDYINIIKSVELKSLYISLVSAFFYVLIAKYLYFYWLGEDVSGNIRDTYIYIYALLIPVLCMNRVYTSLLQYTFYINVLAKQYVFIFVGKFLFIATLAYWSVLISFIFWFFIEFLFLLYNKRLIKNEF